MLTKIKRMLSGLRFWKREPKVINVDIDFPVGYYDICYTHDSMNHRYPEYQEGSDA